MEIFVQEKGILLEVKFLEKDVVYVGVFILF